MLVCDVRFVTDPCHGSSMFGPNDVNHCVELEKMSDLCLVTGGAGFIGCAISTALADSFKRVIAIDNLHPQVHPDRVRPTALDPRVELMVADTTDAAFWDGLLATLRPNVVIHLAAETGTGQSLTEGTRHAHVNVVGTTTMLDALVRHEALPERIALTSSRAVYGEGAWADPTTGAVRYPGQRSKAMLESSTWDFPGLAPLPFEALVTHPNPTSIYGGTKLAQEHVLKAWGEAMGVEVAVLRLQNVYGPGQSLTNPYTGIVPFFARIARRGESIPVYEDGEIYRDFVYIEDVASALVIAARDGVPSTMAYDVGSGVKTSINQLAALIAEIYGAAAPHINGKFRHGDVRSASCTISRTEGELHWQPRTDLRKGITALCAWLDAQSVQ